MVRTPKGKEGPRSRACFEQAEEVLGEGGPLVGREREESVSWEDQIAQENHSGWEKVN